MKILRAETIRDADAYTIKHEPVKSIDLMERAASRCFDWLYQNAPKLFPKSITEEKDWLFIVVSGTGNNGGDGLVIARLLQRNGYNVEILIVGDETKGSKDFETNLGRLGKGAKAVKRILQDADLDKLPDDAIIVDAIFGTGLNRPVEGLALEVIKWINRSHSTVVSIDMPSGVFEGDNAANTAEGMVRADHILTFQTPKLSFFLSENSAFIGRVEILDIGLHPTFLAEAETKHHLLLEAEAKLMREQRVRFSHKGTYGHALIVGGSKGSYGAAMLTSKACLRAGAGLVTAHVPAGASQIAHLSVPEILVSADVEEEEISGLPDLSAYAALGIGPGMGQGEAATRVLKILIQEATIPLVLDADALNILSENKTWMAFLPKGSVLTPHPGEFRRLIGEKLSHYESMERQLEISIKHGIYILLKGAHSSLSTPEGKLIINSTGNPGMASGGMGDALTGMITGLIASGYGAGTAASLGMYVHGRAADMALTNQSHESLIATDLIAYLGPAFQSLDHE